jgi:hypothetical protein
VPRISVRISDELDAKLRAAAEREGLELSEVIRRRLHGAPNFTGGPELEAMRIATAEGIPLWAAKRRIAGST